MESYTHRPLTPPSDRTKINTASPISAEIPSSFNRQEETSPTDSSFLKKERTHEASPFADVHGKQPFTTPTAPILEQSAGSSSNPFRDESLKQQIPNSTGTSFDPSSSSSSKQYNKGTLRNDTTRKIESEVLRILQWQNPLRSGIIFALTAGSIILTRWYSLLQISSTFMTLAIAINLVYVHVAVQSKKVLTNSEASHPYSDVIDNERYTMVDRKSVHHYTTLMSEVAETVIRALIRIVCIENTVTSVKWMSIFFLIWKISAHVSTMDIILTVVISAFIFPRLYISNKDLVDAQLQKGHTLVQAGIDKAQSATTNGIQDTYIKARSFVAQAGTTGTDAKNTMNSTSATVKDPSKEL